MHHSIPGKMGAWCPNGRWGPRRLRTNECAAFAAAETAYDVLLREPRVKMHVGAGGGLLWRVGGTDPHDPMGNPSQPCLAHRAPLPALSGLGPSCDTFVFAEGRCASCCVSQLLGVVVLIEVLELQKRRLVSRNGPEFSGPRDTGDVAQEGVRPCGGARAGYAPP